MEHSVHAVHPLMIIPFALLLGAIAVMPFINRHWWEKYYKAVAVVLGAITAGHYLIIQEDGMRVVEALHEYLSFMALVGSLFVVAGGIHINIRGRSTPNENLVLLAIGAVLANIVGTTGASMLLIRPYLRNNKHRLKPFHVIFFIFVVSNIGGALTPIGDPPLFLGYLKGIPFFWITERTFLPWLLGLVLVLAVFCFLDWRSYLKLPKEKREEVENEDDRTKVYGAWNVLFLAVIIGSVFIEEPVLVREGLMIGAALTSYFVTRDGIHRKNHFTFHPVEEVGWLFIGIFLTMLPALDWLSNNAANIGISSPTGFYWLTGALSGVLDNAPTYLNFLAAAMGMAGQNVENAAHVQSFLGTNGLYVTAISIGAVFFVAMTYIGNGPNFMVKSIAEHAGTKMPTFFTYIIKYSVPVLIPIYLIVWFIFFS